MIRVLNNVYITCDRQKWTGGLMVKTPAQNMGDRGFEYLLVHIFDIFFHYGYIWCFH